MPEFVVHGERVGEGLGHQGTEHAPIASAQSMHEDLHRTGGGSQSCQRRSGRLDSFCTQQVIVDPKLAPESMAPYSRRTKILAVLAALAMAAGAGLFHARSNPTLAGFYGKTSVIHRHTSPPPWPDAGNCFSVLPKSTFYREWCLHWLPGQRKPIEGWRVINMHAENFEALCRQQGFRWVLVERVGERHCLIVDPRVPREWLLHAPCTLCVPMEIRQKLRVERPGCFREDLPVEAGVKPL